MNASSAMRSVPRRSRCRCGASYDEGAFRRLAVLDTLAEPELRTIVVRWPEGVVVEVRRCTTCGEGVARLDRGWRGRDRSP